ncbi:methyltransferase domain-containing protein [Kribbella antibiotica]|uniref:Methyltransferase domain-containing protein n=1 Tax=Kribbella antibiotica TaxID=190195 RepID=A0A4R4ZU72_9ACTN|nr:methyltransferase [Kribbella antibiotica]TDD62698.1 methyltransferase domain-containing protein [Kribbella antibiotica]
MGDDSEEFDQRYQFGRTLVDELGAAGAGPETFELLGMEWDLVPGAYAPKPGTGTEWYTSTIPYPRQGRFLEIGCGAGVTAVWAAQHGCASVLATDITAPAVESTILNTRRHGVEDRVQVRQSDLFAELDSSDRFDLVFWNCSVIEAPADFEFTQDFEWAIFDRGYSALGRYLAQAHDWLLPGGRALVTFNSLGDAERIAQLAAEAGTTLTRLASADRRLAGRDVTYNIFEIVRDPARGR